MTNGSVAITEGLLQRSGLGEHVCLKLDVAGPQKWKPAKEAYHYAVESLQLQGTPEQAGAFPDGVCLHAAGALPGAAISCTLPACALSLSAGSRRSECKAWASEVEACKAPPHRSAAPLAGKLAWQISSHCNCTYGFMRLPHCLEGAGLCLMAPLLHRFMPTA